MSLALASPETKNKRETKNKKETKNKRETNKKKRPKNKQGSHKLWSQDYLRCVPTKHLIIFFFWIVGSLFFFFVSCPTEFDFHFPWGAPFQSNKVCASQNDAITVRDDFPTRAKTSTGRVRKSTKGWSGREHLLREWGKTVDVCCDEWNESNIWTRRSVRGFGLTECIVWRRGDVFFCVSDDINGMILYDRGDKSVMAYDRSLCIET